MIGQNNDFNISINGTSATLDSGRIIISSSNIYIKCINTRCSTKGLL